MLNVNPRRRGHSFACTTTPAVDRDMVELISDALAATLDLVV